MPMTAIERLILALPDRFETIHARQPLPPGATGGPKSGVLAFVPKAMLEPGWNGPFCFARIELADADAGALARRFGADFDKVVRMLIDAAVLKLDLEIERAGG